MTLPLVSILIPVYNAEKWLSETLDSAVGQTWPRKEVVVVDDGSSDESLAIALRYESDTVRVFRNRCNRGQPATLNRAVAESRGDFIQYLDADDVLEPNKIKIQVRRLLEEPPGTISTSAWARFYSDDSTSATFRQHADYQDYQPAVEWLLQSWTGRGTMPPVAWLLSRDVVEKTGPWNEALSLNNDLEYFTRAVLHSEKIAFCPEAKGYYRSGHSSLSGRRDRVASESFFRVCELCTQAMLEFEDSPRTRYACASLWQRFVYRMYPDAPADLVRAAESRVKSLGGTDQKLGGSPKLRMLTSLVGWKAAKRIRRMYYQVRYG